MKNFNFFRSLILIRGSFGDVLAIKDRFTVNEKSKNYGILDLFLALESVFARKFDFQTGPDWIFQTDVYFQTGPDQILRPGWIFGPRNEKLQASLLEEIGIRRGQRGGGIAALLRVGSAAPGLVPAHGVQSPIP